jgi:hypothetical protein
VHHWFTPACDRADGSTSGQVRHAPKISP